MHCKHTIGIVLLIFIGFMSQQQLAHAQQETPPEDSTDTATQIDTDENEPAPAIPAQTENQPTQNQSQNGKKDDGGFFSKLKFWGNGKDKDKPNSEAPETKSDWHELARFNYNAEKHEYYRFGYAQTDRQWVSVFFLRRFKMAERQYNHYLVIQGKPSKETLPSGMKIVELTKRTINAEDKTATALEIKNEGIGFEMPRVPSVSREEKKFDEQQALQLAGFQLSNMGFEDYYWLPDKRENIGEIAEEWNFEVDDK